MFFKTTITVTVLSENPLGLVCNDLGELHYRITNGDCVGTIKDASHEQITGKQCADTLYELGSEPDFFRLDDEGNTINR